MVNGHSLVLRSSRSQHLDLLHAQPNPREGVRQHMVLGTFHVPFLTSDQLPNDLWRTAQRSVPATLRACLADGTAECACYFESLLRSSRSQRLDLLHAQPNPREGVRQHMVLGTFHVPFLISDQLPNDLWLTAQRSVPATLRACR